MIREKVHDVQIINNEAEIETEFINGKIEHFCIGRDEKIYVEIIYQGPIESLLFAAWIEEDSYIPLRQYARDCDNKKLSFSAEKFAANGRFKIYIKGRSDQVVRVSVTYSTEDGTNNGLNPAI